MNSGVVAINYDHSSRYLSLISQAMNLIIRLVVSDH